MPLRGSGIGRSRHFRNPVFTSTGLGRAGSSMILLSGAVAGRPLPAALPRCEKRVTFLQPNDPDGLPRTRLAFERDAAMSRSA